MIVPEQIHYLIIEWKHTSDNSVTEHTSPEDVAHQFVMELENRRDLIETARAVTYTLTYDTRLMGLRPNGDHETF